ncbi:YidC/Oxa1 family membrane protein insertase [Aquihabitans sp. G128]|uniref:YidC/Oxa1 family membrane protein insertase n=1 Tax=Aquihabitans sp. G128 TaxID=2849779 RepID=UPI001C2336E9|nr:YidC/Oxa1 family membrane protein insertase [Aquihabitans sp. G128]
MIILLPLTLKGTRSMLAMQKLQPELKKLQNKHRDDRQKLNEEVMKFYKENNINPMSGCLPLILQMPVFFILYRTLYQLLNRAPYGFDVGAAVARSSNKVNGSVFEKFGYFRPKHLDTSSKLYQDLSSTREMRSFGINLAESAQKAFSHGFTKALPFIVLVLGVTATSYYQQKQIAGRNPAAAAANPQQQMLMKIMPLFFAFISLTLPAGIVVYFLVSNLFRIGQQAFITRTMYRDSDGVVATTGKEVDTSSTAKPGGLLAQLREQGLPSPAKAREDYRAGRGTVTGKTGAKTATKTSAKAPAKGGAKATAAEKPKTAKPAAPSRTAAGPSRTAPQNANRSRTKKKRK